MLLFFESPLHVLYAHLKQLSHVVEDRERAVLIDAGLETLEVLLARLVLVDHLQGLIHPAKLVLQVLNLQGSCCLISCHRQRLLLLRRFPLWARAAPETFEKWPQMKPLENLNHLPDPRLFRSDTAHVELPASKDLFPPLSMILLDNAFGHHHVNPNRLLDRLEHLGLHPLVLAVMRL